MLKLRKSKSKSKRKIKSRNKKKLNKNRKHIKDGSKEKDELEKNFKKFLEKVEKEIKIFKTDRFGRSEYHKFYDETTSLALQLKLEKNRSLHRYLNCGELIVLNLKQVEIGKEENRKKGYFSCIIRILEDLCRINQISLLVSQIINLELTNNLHKNGYTIIINSFFDGDKIIKPDEKYEIKDIKSSEVNAIKIFQTTDSEEKKASIS